MQELFFGGGWFTWNIVNDVYILIKGKKSINAEKNENFELTHCRLQSGYKTQTENLKSFFVWYVKTCHRTTHRASRNRFAAISFHDYLHYFGIFLVHFSMKIDRNIISSLHIVFSLCYWIYNMRKIWETINSFPRGPYYYLFKRYVFILLTKMRTETKTVPSTWYLIFATLVDHIILTYLRKSFIPEKKIK